MKFKYIYSLCLFVSLSLSVCACVCIYSVDRQSYEIITKDSSEIIPGDIISLGDEMTIPCDMIMLSGNAIVDESALTGESCPILKYSIPKNSYELFDPPKHQKYTLFAGTELICVKNSDEPAIALAVHTGFNTTKGHIVRSILHPPESTISLHHDTWLCLGALFVASTVLAVYSVYNSLMRHQALIDVFTYALDMYATGIPPEIPVILMSCSIRAVSAMKKRHLHCISPKYINEAGKIELIAFDKTGTLTEAGLEVCGVCLPYVSELQSESESENEGVVHVHKKLRSWLTLTPPQEKLGKCLPILASCHSLTMFEDKIIGDPIDIEMFKFTGWKLEERFEGSEMSTIAVPPLATANGNDPESINGGNGDGNNNSSSANGDGAENNYLMRSSYMDSSSSSDDSDYSDDSSSSSDYDNSGTSDSGDGSGSDRNGNGISDDDDDDDDEDEDPTGHTKFKKKTFRWKGSMNRNGIVTVKRFEFNPELRRQVVIIKSFEVNAYAVVAKGAPEVIKRLCQPATIPTNFDMVLASLASQGKRVLGLAGKKLNVGRPQDVRDMRQEDVENGLEFHGLLVLSNTLKPESAPVIAELSAANIRSVMVTGDNMQTAVNVSKACGIISPELPVYYGELRNGHVCWVPSSPGMPELDTLTLTPISDYSTSSPEPDEPLLRTNSRGSSNRNNNNNHHYKSDDSNDSECGDECRPLRSAGYGLRSKYKYALAIHGDAFQALLEGNLVTYHALLSKAQVFARMKPDQKTTLIKTFENVLDVYTCMCGDGANDCGALQAADVGLSIGDSEASIAGVFTSEVENISTVPDLIKEGRCSLLISFTMVKFMVLYSMIGIDSLIFVYLVGADYSDWEFFYYDVVLIYPLYFASKFYFTHMNNHLFIHIHINNHLFIYSFTLIIIYLFIYFCSVTNNSCGQDLTKATARLTIHTTDHRVDHRAADSADCIHHHDVLDAEPGAVVHHTGHRDRGYL